MSIDIEEIVNGKLDGKIVWICDLRFNDYSNKPIRRIKPTKVMIRGNQHTNKNIYYSQSHFVGLNKRLEAVKSKVWAVFDTTGYRTYRGEPLEVFVTESECRERYRQLVKIATLGLNIHVNHVKESIDKLIGELEEEA